jgi:carboxylesterase
VHTCLWREKENAQSLVVFVHGLMGSPGQFRDLLEDAHALGCSAYAPILPGHGGTSRDFARYGLAAWEEHLQKELAKYAGAYRNIILAGHSMGGLLALNASLDPQNRVRGVFLLAAPLKLRLGPRSLYLKLRLVAFPRGHHIKTAYWQAKSLSNLALSPGWLKPFWGFRQLMKKTLRNLPQVYEPVLAIHSRYDETVSFRSAELLYGGLQNSARKRITLEKSWHAYYPPEEWQAVRTALLEFIHTCLEDSRRL